MFVLLQLIGFQFQRIFFPSTHTRIDNVQFYVIKCRKLFKTFRHTTYLLIDMPM